jgi:hypothetical protein
MITLFTTAKAFTGEAGKRQEAALLSWKRLAPDIEIILFGDGPGYHEAVERWGLIHCRDVPTGERGCPRIDAMFREVERMGRHRIKGYVNADIILMDDLIQALPSVRRDEFLLLAERVNVDFPNTEWPLNATAAEIRAFVAAHGVRAYHTAVDLFVYRGDIWRGLPPLVVGRGWYDNFLVYECRRRKTPVIDASGVVTIIHQNHDYSHLQGGVLELNEGVEAMVNRAAMGDLSHAFTIADADWALTPNGLIRSRCRDDGRRYAETTHTLAVGRQSVVQWVPAVVLEAWCQICQRCRELARGRVMPIAKFPLWVVARLFSRR